MRVVCIKHFKSQGLQYELTYGKAYDVLPKPNWANPESFFIKCDRGFISSYHKNSFMLLEEWWERQLNKVL